MVSCIEKTSLEIIGNKVRNPITKRLISINGATYRKLCIDKILDVSQYTSANNIIYEGPNAKDFMANVNKDALNIPKNKTLYVKDNRVLTRNVRVTKKMIDDKSKEIGLEVYRKNPELFVGLSPEQVTNLIQRLVKEELIRDKSSEISKKMQFVIDNISDDSDDSEYDADYSDEYSDEGDEGEVEILETIPEVEEEEVKEEEKEIEIEN